MKKLLLLFFLTCNVLLASGQVTLTGSSYTENFDNLFSGLPSGFSVYTGATSSSLGTVATLTTTHTARNNTVGSFKNFASLPNPDAAGTTNRALGVRQTGSFGDPGAAFVFKLDNTTGITGIDLTFDLQSLDAASPRTTNWTVQYAIGASPNSFSNSPSITGSLQTGASTTTTNSIVADFGNALDNISQPVWIRIVALTPATGTGNRASSGIDNFVLTYSSNPNAPSIAISPGSLTFPNQNINTTSSAKSVTLNYSNLTTADVNLTAVGPYTIAKTETGTYSTSFAYTNAELNTNTTNFFVKFTPTAAGNSTGTVSISGGGVSSTSTVNLSGVGVDPNQTAFNFESCSTNGSSSLSDGFTQYSVTGAQTWGCASPYGRNAADASGATNAGNGLQVNGYASTNNLNEDWLISPVFNISTFNFPILSYWTRNKYVGAQLQLKVSTNYSGTGSPTAPGVTWTDLDGKFPTVNSDKWTKSDNIDLSSFKSSGSAVYIAFVYNSTTEDGARWTIDDFSLTNSATAPPAEITSNPTSLDMGFVTAGQSATSTLNITSANLTGSISLTTNGDFTVSTDNVTYGTTATITNPGNATTAIYVKFSPASVNQSYTGALYLENSAVSNTVNLSGSTVSKEATLDVVNWNIEWFGGSNGPSDNVKQKANVIKVMKNLNADVYALGEIVSTTELADVAAAIGASATEYGYYVSEYGSYAQNTSDPDYANAQKLAFIYRKSVITPIGTAAPLLYTANESDPVFNYWASGRFPYELKANVTLQGTTKQVNFIMIHAKAETSSGSYARRKNAAASLKTYLDANEATDNFIILGDYNDDLDQTISDNTSGGADTDFPNSSYKAWIDDAARYTSVTLPLSLAGKKSTVSYNDVIDHVTLSNEMKNYYLNNSAQIVTSVTGIVSPDNYGATTSDHYPVLTRYAFDPVVLPIKLASFTAQAAGDKTNLKWTTESEVDNDYFLVERAGEDKNFITVSRVKGSGSSNASVSYSSIDYNPLAGNNYYRLKQVDFDGKFSYSDERVVKFSSLNNNKLTVFPNPTSDKITLNLSEVSGKVSLKVVGVDGKSMISEEGTLEAVNQKLNSKLSGFAPGVYIISLTANGQQHKIKFVKQ